MLTAKMLTRTRISNCNMTRLLRLWGAAGNLIISFVLGFTLASVLAGWLLYLTVTGKIFHQGQASFKSHFTFTPNWAGVVLPSPPHKQRFAATKASVALPSLVPRENSTTLAAPYTTSIWVSLDAKKHNTYGSAGLRSGVSITLLPTGETILANAYQWGSDGPHEYTKIGLLSPGDTLDLEVVMFNDTFAKAEIRNANTERLSIKYWSKRPPSREALKGLDAEWILEHPSASVIDGSGSPKSASFEDFGRIILQNCVAWTNKDEMVTAEQGDVYRILQGGVARTGVHAEDEFVFVTCID
jgi:hypothetical protein